MARAIQAASQSGQGFQVTALGKSDRTEVDRLYQRSGNMPVWLAPSGKLRGVGRDAVRRLLEADSEGLRPKDYGAAEFDSATRRLATGGGPADPRAVAELDVGLSVAVLRFLRHVHVGRVNPRSVGLQIDPPADRHDFAALMNSGLEQGSLEKTVDQLSPPLAQYGLVRKALADYRRRVNDSLIEHPIQFSEPLKPGMSAPGLDSLARRLVQTGDLASLRGLDSVPARYEGLLAAAVARFQSRHGLAPDSVLGKATLEELNVPLSRRIHQLDLALERLRWIGDLPEAPFILVNIPMFELTTWTSPTASGPPEFRTGVIVGGALDHQTPLFSEDMRYIVFRPYWNVPPSILKDEVLPALGKKPDYLRRQRMDIVAGPGDDAKVVEQSDDAIDRLEQGRLRVRQRPGPGNSLGLVKFVFPNNQNIYLHGTPAEQLFDRARRDFSHGCVRVEDPVGLAEWLLADQPEWDRVKIVQAMDDDHRVSRRLNLTHPVKVVLFYATAYVEPDGAARFARDIYGHDERIEQALHLNADLAAKPQ
jgi:murein L,D-transpeptidase YcbB/YkuD